MLNKIYFIEGIFFQVGDIYSKGHNPGTLCLEIIQDSLTHCIYHGIVFSIDYHERFFEGCMVDLFGKSVITDFEISINELKFKKKYAEKPIINYSFNKKEGNIWIGEFSGEHCGLGDSKCIITQFEKSFFSLP